MATPPMQDVNTHTEQEHHQQHHHQHDTTKHSSSVESRQGQTYHTSGGGGGGFSSADPTFLFPLLFGAIVWFAWLITMLVIQSSDNASIGLIWAFTANTFLIQATTFAVGVCLTWYALNNIIGNYFLLSAIYNYIIVCMWLFMIVPAYGFFQWDLIDLVVTDTRLKDSYKAASIFSFFIMLIHFIWFILHIIKAIKSPSIKFLFSGDLRGFLLILTLINLFAYLLWFAGRLAIADKESRFSGGDASLIVYIITLSVTICILLTFSYLESPSTTIIVFNLTWHVLTSLMLWSVIIIGARSSDKESKIYGGVYTTDSGKTVVTAIMLFMITETISAVIFAFIKFRG